MQNDYLITQKPWKALVLFSLPIMLGNLFQQLYTMVDSAIVGRYVGEQALAAVGASYALTTVFICVAIGGGIGASVIVSRAFGAQEYSRMKSAIYTACLTFLGVAILLSVFGLVFSRRIMIALNTPADALENAVLYLNIYFFGLPFLFMYNIVSSMFNALGKSRIPLCFLVFSSVLNVVLDWLFVVQFHTGVAGAAWATFLAQGLSAVLSFGVLLYLLQQFKTGRVRSFDRAELSSMVRIALPSILQQSTVSIGMMLVQSVVNGFGAEALAGFSAAMRIESICCVPMNGIGNAMSSYTAQNLGAGKNERVQKGLHAAFGMVVFFGLVICVWLECFHQELMVFFLGENGTAAAMTTGNGYLTFMGWFFCLIGFKMAVDGLLRGAGDTKMFTIANLANLGIRVAAAFTLAPIFGVSMVWCAVPLGWFVNWLISFVEYRTGKWKSALRTEQEVS